MVITNAPRVSVVLAGSWGFRFCRITAYAIPYHAASGWSDGESSGSRVWYFPVLGSLEYSNRENSRSILTRLYNEVYSSMKITRCNSTARCHCDEVQWKAFFALRNTVIPNARIALEYSSSCISTTPEGLRCRRPFQNDEQLPQVINCTKICVSLKHSPESWDRCVPVSKGLYLVHEFPPGVHLC